MAHKLKHESKNTEVVIADSDLDFYLAHGWVEIKEAKRANNTGRAKKPTTSTK